MVFDFRNNREVALANGIVEKSSYDGEKQIMRSENGAIIGQTFCNFPRLVFEDNVIVMDCVFEDCGIVEFDENKIHGCTFRRIKMISATDSTISNSTFCELKGNEDYIITVDDSEINSSIFCDIELRDDSYLIDGNGASWVEKCKFENCTTTRRDRELFYCAELRGTFVKKLVHFKFVDEDSCEGLDRIK